MTQNECPFCGIELEYHKKSQVWYCPACYKIFSKESEE